MNVVLVNREVRVGGRVLTNAVAEHNVVILPTSDCPRFIFIPLQIQEERGIHPAQV